jgi:uncharacterized protein
MRFDPGEIIDTLAMVRLEHLDIRTVTLGLSLRDCAHGSPAELVGRVRQKIRHYAHDLVPISNAVQDELGIPIVNRRLSLTPLSLLAEGRTAAELVALARGIDEEAGALGIDFVGGFSALVHKGYTRGDHVLIETIPHALSVTERLCGSVNVATTRAGINMDAVRQMGSVIKELAERTADRDGIGCAKLVVFANAPEDNPFMAGAFHGVGEPECVINVGVSGPGVVLKALEALGPVDLGTLSEAIKRTACKIVRAGEVVGRAIAQRLGVEFGILDVSLAPTPEQGDSVADILEAMGLERTGTHGSTAALALLVDAVKKGGAMASSYVGGLSGAFIPVSEDRGMIEAARAGTLSLAKLEAMTAVCSVGLDMVAVPGDTPASTISAIIADEVAIGVMNRKTTGVRIIPVPGKGVGQEAVFGGLLGVAPIMAVNQESAERFIHKGGRIPAPLQSLIN